MENSGHNSSSTISSVNLHKTVRNVLVILTTFLLFFFSLDLLIATLQHAGTDTVKQILLPVSNPFAGLFIGLLITAIIQSSSTTTALAVALVASGTLSLQNAVPVIMGANVGTTITSLIVSLGFIGKKKEFKRAFTAGSYHCFFNILSVIILFPLEYYYQFLSEASYTLSKMLFAGSETSYTSVAGNLDQNALVVFLFRSLQSDLLLVLVAFALLFASILLFRKVISALLKAGSPENFSRFFFKHPLKSFSWGVLTTAAIRSSTITTSVVVPIVAKRITSLKLASPFILGANIGTTITAFIAVAVNASGTLAASIALSHFLFNAVGVLFFFPIKVLREVPIRLARGMGELAMQNSVVALAFILVIFFILPLALIFLYQGGFN